MGKILKIIFFVLMYLLLGFFGIVAIVFAVIEMIFLKNTKLFVVFFALGIACFVGSYILEDRAKQLDKEVERERREKKMEEGEESV